MDSVPVWPPRVVGASLRPAGTVAASVCPPERTPPALPVARPDAKAPPPRLKRRAEFLAVRAGEKRRGRFFLMEVLDRKDGGPARAGFTVTKKVGNAVVRNRVRRRLKEALRVHAAADMAGGHDYVIVGRGEVLAAPFDALAGEMVRRMRPPPR